MSFGFGFGFPKRLTSGGGLSPSLYLDFVGTGLLPSTVTFSRGTNATLTDSNGRIAWAPHNLLTNSEDFEAAGWNKNGTTVSGADINATTAPDGTVTADRVRNATSTGNHDVYASTSTVAATYTFSAYLKADGVSWACLVFQTPDGINRGCFFDLANGVRGTEFNSATGSISPVSGATGWYRCVVTATAPTAGTSYPIICVATANGSGRPSYLGDTSQTMFLWGAQLNVANAPVNLLTWSEQYSNAVYSITSGVTFSGNVATFAASGYRYQLFSSATNIVGATYTAQVKLSSPSGKATIVLRIANNSLGADGSRRVINLTSTPTVYTITHTFANSGFGVDVGLENRVALSGDGIVGDVIATEFQLNTGSTALPYVATTSSIFLPPAYNSTTPKNLLGFTQEPENAAWTKSNSYVQQNLLTWSEDFSNPAWALDNGAALNPVVTANSGVAPNGSTTADRIVFNRTGGTFSRIQQSAVSTIGLQYTFSVWMKTFTAGTTANVGIRVDLNGVNCVVTENWTRFTVTTTTTAGSTAGQILLFSSIPGNDLTADVLVWGAQLVQGSTAGDYTQTTSAAAPTRYLNFDGTLTGRKLVENTATNTHYAYQTPTLGIGVYTLSVYLKAAERTWALINVFRGSTFSAYINLLTGELGFVSGGTATVTNAGNGWWRAAITFTVTVAGSSDLGVLTTTANGTSSYTGDGTSGIYVSDFQLSNSASVDPYVYNPQAAAASAAYYGPRFDYNPTTLAANGLLIEEQRVNYCLYSEQYDNAAWVKSNVTVTPNTFVAPDGNTTADTLTASAANGTVTQAITTTAVAMTYSVYLRRKTGTGNIDITMDGTTWVTQTISSTAWTRCIVTQTGVAGTSNPGVRLVTNGDEVYVWGSQVE